MGWRDFQESVSLEFMESMELIVNEFTPLIPLIPLIPPIAILETQVVAVCPEVEPANKILTSADSYPASDWRPEPRAWLTEAGEFRANGVFVTV